MVIYAILMVGAASSRDHAMIAIKRLFSRLEAAPTSNLGKVYDIDPRRVVSYQMYCWPRNPLNHTKIKTII